MYTSIQIGALVRQTRAALNMTQEELALTAGTRARFISDLENGKATCQLGKVLIVLQTLGIQMSLSQPSAGIETVARRRKEKSQP
jgi:y4mF family transcriptional regulator